MKKMLLTLAAVFAVTPALAQSALQTSYTSQAILDGTYKLPNVQRAVAATIGQGK
jgi:hypothetical protein